MHADMHARVADPVKLRVCGVGLPARPRSMVAYDLVRHFNLVDAGLRLVRNVGGPASDRYVYALRPHALEGEKLLINSHPCGISWYFGLRNYGEYAIYVKPSKNRTIWSFLNERLATNMLRDPNSLAASHADVTVFRPGISQ